MAARSRRVSAVRKRSALFGCVLYAVENKTNTEATLNPMIHNMGMVSWLRHSDAPPAAPCRTCGCYVSLYA
jgi:hypothetical protein